MPEVPTNYPEITVKIVPSPIPWMKTYHKVVFVRAPAGQEQNIDARFAELGLEGDWTRVGTREVPALAEDAMAIGKIAAYVGHFERELTPEELAVFLRE